MGWKNLKTHFRIEHIVQVTSDGICIGSGFVHNFIVVGADGRLTKRLDRISNKDLARYQEELEIDPSKVRALIEAPDTFAASNPVFTFDGGRIIEKQCEVLGWPNVTHDGEIMYENRFSTDRATVVEWAKENAAAGIKFGLERVQRAEEDLEKARQSLARREADLTALNTAYPAAAVCSG